MNFLRNRLPWVMTGLVAGIFFALFIRAFASTVVSQVHAVAGTATFTGSTASFSAEFTQGGNQPIRTAFGPLRLDYKSGPNAWTTGFLMREGDGNVSIGANITSADFNSASKLRVLGVVESTTGGFKFPDGTTQTTAASGNVSGWTDGGTNVYLTTASDKVGIGTTSPGTKLDVDGSISQLVTHGDNVKLWLSAARNGAATGEVGLYSWISEPGVTWTGGGIGRNMVNTNGFPRVNAGLSGQMIRFDENTTNPSIIFTTETSSGTRYTSMTIYGNNVGIGSTAPGAKLEVAGNINSSTGAIQTAGVTRIDNSGVGTFAAGTTIGGAAVTAAVVDKTLASGRLTLTSGTPVTTADVTAATTVYYTPYDGDVISLYDGTSTWTTLTFSELSLALTNYTANTNYDIWAYNNSGTVALESTAWTNDTTRATAIVKQNGVWVKTGATTRRLLGTIRITGTTGQTEDSRRNRLVFNVNNRVNRALLLTYTGSWYEEGYYTAWRYLNNNDSTQFIGVVRSLDEDAITMDMTSARRVVPPSFDGGAYYAWAHAEISIDTPGSNTTGNAAQGADGYSGSHTMTAHYTGYPGVGYHKVIPSIYVSLHSYYGGAEYLNTTIGGDNGVGTKGGATGTAMQ